MPVDFAEFDKIERGILAAGGEARRSYLNRKEGFIASLAEHGVPRYRAYAKWKERCMRRWTSDESEVE